jgi:hypothetical protein
VHHSGRDFHQIPSISYPTYTQACDLSIGWRRAGVCAQTFVHPELHGEAVLLADLSFKGSFVGQQGKHPVCASFIELT